jgi:hypothetical protein
VAGGLGSSSALATSTSKSEPIGVYKVYVNDDASNYIPFTVTYSNCSVYVGFGARGGITNTAWQPQAVSTSAVAAPALNGTVGYLTPEFLLTSKTYIQESASTSGQGNQYQFGVGVGPSWRLIGGDLAQGRSTATTPTLRSQLLGTDQTSFTGFEVTFFVRMNQFKPYVRYSHFSAPNKINILGLTGSQFVFGVDVLSAIYQTTLGSGQ